MATVHLNVKLQTLSVSKHIFVLVHLGNQRHALNTQDRRRQKNYRRCYFLSKWHTIFVIICKRKSIMICPYLLVVIVIDLSFNPREELFPKGWPENFLALLLRYEADDTIYLQEKSKLAPERTLNYSNGE